MAYTKVFAIRARLDDRVKYAINGDKTELGEKINYAADLQKMNSVRFVSALNCKSAETAFAAMRRTKEKFCKTGGVLGYHFIQSFAPGEVTPEQAHEIGCEFARRLFGEDFEVVVGTHLDKAHPHNHIIVNSVSRIDGHKYHSSPESYYNDVRGTSDELCRENNLSVIAPRGKGKHYAEWKAEQGGKPTVRGVIRDDIDATIQQAYTYDSFLMLLRKNGYEVRRGPNRKYTTVKPPGAKRAIRLDSLGESYTEADILRRLSRQRRGGMAAPIVIRTVYTVKRYRVKGKLNTARKKKITGFYALYLRYLYLLRGGRRKKLPPMNLSIWRNQNMKKLKKKTMLRADKVKKCYWTAAGAAVLCLCCATHAMAASGDPLDIVNNLSDFIFSIIKALGVIILGWGIVQVGMSIQSHDASQRTQGFLCLFGGLMIAFAKEILSAIGAI